MGILEGLTPQARSVPLAEQAPTEAGERFSAGYKRQTILTNAWNFRKRIRNQILSEQSLQVFGDPNVWIPAFEPKAFTQPHIDQYFNRIRTAAQVQPAKFGPIIKSRDELEEAVTTEMKRQLEEAERILGNAPGDAFAVQTLGELARATTHEAVLASGLLGVGAGAVARMGLLSTIASEAALGATAEMSLFPEMQEQAERLGVEAPDAAMQLLLGAAGGALFPVAGEILRRGVTQVAKVRGAIDRFSYARTERSTTAGADEATHDAGIQKAGEAVQNDDPGALPDQTDRMPDRSFRPSRGPQGIDATGQDFERVVDALIQRESSGDPTALGPVIEAGANKGDQAIGLTQVMPNTAREIAREIGDGRFPHNGTNEQITEYLSDPKINRRYGSHYLRKQLERYDGDLEAALVAYNAGPGNADRWIEAGRDYSALPQPEQTRPYVDAILADLGAASDDMGRGFNAAPRAFRAADLDVEPDRFQFKASDADGRTGTLAGRAYDEDAAGTLLVYERQNGRRTVVNGHERLALAREAGPDTRVNAIVLRESDGWTENAVLARAGIYDFIQSQVDAESAARALTREAALREAQTRQPDLFSRIEQAENRLLEIQRTFDTQGLAEAQARVESADIDQVRGELERLQAERERLVSSLEAETEVRPEDAAQAARVAGATDAEAARIFDRAPERGLGATVKDVASHVRGRVPDGARRRGDVVSRGSGPPDEDGLSAVAQQRLAEFADADSAARAEAADEALREIETQLPEGEDFAVAFDENGEVALTARQVIAEARDDADFLEKLDLCKVGSETEATT